MSTPRPVPDSYWLIDGQLLAGEYPGSWTRHGAEAKLALFLDAGIRTFIDLTFDTEPLEPYDGALARLAVERNVECRYRRLPIEDMGVPSCELMTEILAAIVAELDEGRPVYVHCWGGIGRTGTVAGCWLVEAGMPADEALKKVQTLRWGTSDGWTRSPETDEQCEFVRSWNRERSTPSEASGTRGAILGLATGDALGTTLEFKPPDTFEPIDDMRGGGPFKLNPGQWTDDTSMMLCLAESLIETGGFDARDQLERYVRWWQNGYHSSTGRCFDIGNTVREALQSFLTHGNPERTGVNHANSAGNGSLMRLAPVPLFYRSDPERAIAMAAASSRPTHAHVEAIDACRYMAGLMIGAMNSHSKEDLMQPLFSPVAGLWERQPLHANTEDVARGSFLRHDPPRIQGSGYVTRSVEAALWAFSRSNTFEDGALLAVNLGDDADTTAAIYGQLAGAFYGVDAIPERWRSKLARLDVLESVAARLHDRA